LAIVTSVILLAFFSLRGLFFRHRFCRLLFGFFPLVFALPHGVSSLMVSVPLRVVKNSGAW
jgi:hypothetical protein